MAPCNPFPLPLTSNAPPAGYGWEERSVSSLSSSTAFLTGIYERDQFLGVRRCIICGESGALDHCYIIPQAEELFWFELKRRNWIPRRAKRSPEHEPRNGLLMCANHHRMFNNYRFFVRFVPETGKFVLVNYSSHDDLHRYHGKAVALDIRDHYAPYPSLFIIHEMRVRGCNPFSLVAPDIPDSDDWQDWIMSGGVFDSETGYFKREAPPEGSGKYDDSLPSLPQFPPTATDDQGGTTHGTFKAVLNEDVINEILAATHAMPSWKACEIEGTSWAGTGEENIKKYTSTIGVEKDSGIEEGTRLP